MQTVKWSPSEKTIARAAFDRAYARECDAILREVQSMLNNGKGARVIWDMQEYLTERRREIDAKYDFRYSQLMLLFARLLNDGWLLEDELDGLAPEKLEILKRASGV